MKRFTGNKGKNKKWKEVERNKYGTILSYFKFLKFGGNKFVNSEKITSKTTINEFKKIFDRETIDNLYNRWVKIFGYEKADL